MDLGGNDDLFKFIKFDDKKDDKTEEENALKIIKYNPPHTNDIMDLQSPTDYSNHLDNVQSDLDSLKDFLRTDNYPLETNQLLGVSRK